MRFAFTDEQLMLRDAVAGAIGRDLPLPRVRDCLDTGDLGPADALRRAGEWAGIGVAEEAGGQGGTTVERAILAEQLGRGAVPGSLPIAGAIAASLLEDTGPGARETLRALCEGLAVVPLLCAGRGPGEELVAREGRVDGTVRAVLGAPEATALVGIVDGRLVRVDAGAPGVTVTPCRGLDPGRTIGDVTLDGAVAADLGPVSDADRARDLGAVLVTAEALGAARRLLDLTVAYVQEREQFGVAIGSFQAVKHTAADMLVDVETAHSATYFAAWARDGADAAQAGVAAAVAKSYGTAAATRVADSALALHGAVGFTWEHVLHLLLKRAHSSRRLYGSAAAHRERIAASLDLDPAGPAGDHDVPALAGVGG